ncbi:MAG: hypothetical protein ABI382_03315 [Nakamurella sp.]
MPSPALPSASSPAQPSGPAPAVIPPPGTVRVAAILVALQGLGLVMLAGLTLVSGLDNHASGAQLGAQVGYFAILGAALVFVASGLLRGRRWGRTPALVAQVVAIAVGMWMAFPSARLAQGLALIGFAALTFGLLVSPRANHWIKLFPAPFGLEEDR